MTQNDGKQTFGVATTQSVCIRVTYTSVQYLYIVCIHRQGFQQWTFGHKYAQKFQPVHPNFKLWTSKRPNQSASYYVYLSIINCELTSEYIFECFISSTISTDSRVSEYLISWRCVMATMLTRSLNSSNPETATFVLLKLVELNVACFYKKAQLSLRKMHYSLIPVALLTFKVIQGQWLLCHLKANSN